MAENTIQINNSRGIGFLMFYDNSEPEEERVTYSKDNALKNINKIPLYHYIVIDNSNSEEHGTMYQKVIDTQNSYEGNIVYTLDEIYQLASIKGNAIETQKIQIIQSGEGSETIDENFHTYLDKLLKFFQEY